PASGRRRKRPGTGSKSPAMPGPARCTATCCAGLHNAAQCRRGVALRREHLANDVIAVYPGTFDPMTLGHEDVIRRALTLFGTVIVAVAAGHHKKALFTLQERIDMAREALVGHPQVQVEGFTGLV